MKASPGRPVDFALKQARLFLTWRKSYRRSNDEAVLRLHREWKAMMR